MLISDGICAFQRSLVGVLAPASILFYQRRLPSLIEFLGDVELSSVTIDQLRAWRAWLTEKTTRWGGGSSRPACEGGLSPYTLHQYVRACKRLFKWLEAEGKNTGNPAKRLELPQLPKQYRRGLRAPDRDLILEQAELNGVRDYAICLFLADTACRLGGLVGLRLDDLDLEACRAVLREKGRGGQRKERPVFYLEATRQALRDYLAVRPLVKHDAVFCSLHGGGPLSSNGVYELIKRLAKKAGIPRGWNPHSWRHGSIRGMLSNGLSLPAASQIAGHSSVKVTGDIYGIFDEAELQRMHAQHSWVS
jgi:site-specific recombinase XerD